MKEIEDVRQELLLNIDDLMNLIDRRKFSDISESEIQRQLGFCFYIWEKLTRLQRGEIDA